VTNPLGIALDLADGKMYWVETTFSGDIRRANLDGTGSQTLVSGLIFPTGIAIGQAVVPEPSSLLLLVVALGGVAYLRSYMCISKTPWVETCSEPPNAGPRPRPRLYGN
jgi:hypothetical protein